MKNNKIIKLITSVSLGAILAFSPCINNKQLFYTQTAYATTTEAQGMLTRIDSLPMTEDLTEQDAKEVQGLMEAYAELPMNEKLEIENYEKLKTSYDKLVRDGFITNEMQSELEEKQNRITRQKSKSESTKTATKQTEYNFKIARDEQVTIMMRYTVDIDGDGITDTPDRVTMTSPSGKTYPVSNSAINMKDENLINALTWTDNYLQMDIGYAEEGLWTIQVSVPVTFSQEAYQGAALTIDAEDGKKGDLASRGIVYDKEGNPINKEDEADENNYIDEDEEKTKKKSGGGGSIIMIFLLGGALAGLFVFIKKKGAGGSSKLPKSDDDDVIDQPKPMSDDEMMAQLRKEYDEKEAAKKEMEEANNDMAKNKNVYVPKRKSNNPYMDDIDTNDEEMEQYLEEYREGDTGLLSEEDKKDHFDNDEEDASFFETL